MSNKRKLNRISLFDCLNVALIILMSVVFLYPYWNQVVLAFNDGTDAMFGGIYLWPRQFTTMNFKMLFANQDVWRATFLTILNVICATLGSIIVTTSAAYAMSKKQLPFRNHIIWFFLIPTYVPAGLIAQFILYRYLNLLNTQLIYWITGVFSFYNMIIMRTFIQGLPDSIEEAAIIDGASEVTVFLRIIIPLCAPVIATVSLWVIVGAWNNYSTSLYFITDKRLYSLQYVIMRIIKKNEIIQEVAKQAEMLGGGENIENAPTTEAMKSAAIVFSTIPIVCAYPFLQKYFVKGVTVGAVKD